MLERMTENQFCLTRYPQVTLHLILKDNVFARLAPSIRRYKMTNQYPHAELIARRLGG